MRKFLVGLLLALFATLGYAVDVQYKTGNQPVGPVAAGVPFEVVFNVPAPLPDLTNSNGSVEIKQLDQLAADFTVSFNGSPGKTDNQDVRFSFRNSKYLKAGRNVVTITSKYGSSGFNVLITPAK